ncbi:MAG: RsmE family RNA methyltransferase, partial [Flavobacteriales bacterium]
MKQEYNFYAPQQVLTDGAALPDEEASHFLKSLRGRSGDVLKITDGCGKLYSASAQVNKSAVVLCNLTLIEETVEDNLPTLAVGLLKHTDRIEWLVEKAIEIGVKEIVWLL